MHQLLIIESYEVELRKIHIKYIFNNYLGLVIKRLIFAMIK